MPDGDRDTSEPRIEPLNACEVSCRVRVEDTRPFPWSGGTMSRTSPQGRDAYSRPEVGPPLLPWGLSWSRRPVAGLGVSPTLVAALGTGRRTYGTQHLSQCHISVTTGASRPEVKHTVPHRQGRGPASRPRSGPSIPPGGGSDRQRTETWTWSMWFAVALPRLDIVDQPFPGIQIRWYQMM